MRYSDLREDAPAKNIQDMISTIALSLITSGKTEVSTKGLAAAIAKRTGIDVPYGVLMDILMQLPFIQDVNSDVVTLSSGNDSADSSTGTSPEESVTDMATKAAVSASKDKI